MFKAGKKIHPLVKLLVSAIVLFYLAGCASVRGQWQQAKSKDTKQAYRVFIRKYPNSPYTAKARQILESLSWKQVKLMNQRVGYRKFLKDFPDGFYHKEALLGIETIDLRVATRKNTKAAYVKFLQVHPNGFLSQKAKKRIEEYDWQMVKRQRTFHAYKRFLDKYPDGKFNNEAKEKVAEGTWIEIQSGRSAAAFKKFLADFPESRFTKQAGKRLKELEKTDQKAERHWDQIKGNKYFKSFSEFIWRYPTSKKVPLAVEAVYNLLRRKYPAEKFTFSPSLVQLKKRLPEAIRNQRPMLAVFAPVVVEQNQGRWQWTSHFQELAGVSVFFNHMSPRIRNSQGKTFTFVAGGDAMLGSCHIKPYGSCKHTWRCRGDFIGSTVYLNYGKGLAVSRTTLEGKE